LPYTAGAGVIVQQPNTTTTLENVYPFGFAVGSASSTIFTVLATSTATRAQWVWKSLDWENSQVYLAVVKHPQNSTSCQTFASTTSAGLNNFNQNIESTGDDCELVPGQQYFIAFGSTVVGTIENESSVGVFDGSGRPFFKLYDDSIPSDFATTTRILPPWSPNAGVIEPNNNVPFLFDFYHNTAPGNTIYEKLGVQIVNNTASYTYNTESLESDIVASGIITYNASYSLPTGDAFAWRAYARKGSSYVYGPWLSFSVVEQNLEASPFTQYPDILTATSTGEFGFISGIGGLIMQKIPFVWFTQIGSTINSLNAEATTTPELTYTASSTIFGTILGGEGEINLISEDIFERFISDNVHTTYMLLQAIGFYLAGMMYIYRRSFSFFDKSV